MAPRQDRELDTRRRTRQEQSDKACRPTLIELFADDTDSISRTSDDVRLPPVDHRYESPVGQVEQVSRRTDALNNARIG